MRPPWWMGVTDVVDAHEAHSDILRMKGAMEGLADAGDGLDSEPFVSALRDGRIRAYAFDPEVDDVDMRNDLDPEIAAGVAARISDIAGLESYLDDLYGGVDNESEEHSGLADLRVTGTMLLDRDGLASVARGVFGLAEKGGRPPDPDQELYLTKYFRGDFETKGEGDRWLVERRRGRGEGDHHPGIERVTRRWIRAKAPR